MPYIPQEELPSFIGGAVGIIIVWVVLYSIRQHYPTFKVSIAKTINTREFALFTLQLVLVAIGISVSVDALALSAGGNNMTTEQLNSLYASAHGLLHAVYILLGVAAGAVLIWFIHLIIVSIIEQRKHRNHENKSDLEFTISTQKLASTLKEIEESKKAMAILGEFFNKLGEK